MNNKTKKSDEGLTYWTPYQLVPHMCQYYIVVGERSNGKTFAMLKLILEDYFEHGFRSVYIRQMDIDITTNLMGQVYDDLVNKGVVRDVTGGVWTDVVYKSRQWFLCYYDDDGNRVTDETPFMYARSISGAKHTKSITIPNARNIFYDEFINADGLIPNEFKNLVNIVSTTFRNSPDGRVWLVANTVDPHSNYYTLFGLGDIKKYPKGQISLLESKQQTKTGKKMRIAFEYTDTIIQNDAGKPSDIYFLFDGDTTGTTKMITDGEWEIGIYPKLPFEFEYKEIKRMGYIYYNESVLRVRVIKRGRDVFAYIDSTDQLVRSLIDEERDTLFKLEFTHLHNELIYLDRQYSDNRLSMMLAPLFTKQRIFFEDDSIGKMVTSYLKESKHINILNI